MHKSCDLKFLHVKCSLIDTFPFAQDYEKLQKEAEEQRKELDMKLKTAQQVSNNFTSNTTQILTNLLPKTHKGGIRQGNTFVVVYTLL